MAMGFTITVHGNVNTDGDAWFKVTQGGDPAELIKQVVQDDLSSRILRQLLEVAVVEIKFFGEEEKS